MRQPQVRAYAGAPVQPRATVDATVTRLDVDVARAVLDNTAALVTIFDVEGRVLLFNRACEELSGFRADEVVGRPVWDSVIVPDERELAAAEIPMIVASGRGAVVEGTWQDRWGGRHLIAWHNTVLPDAAGAPSRMACIGVDITEQRHTEVRLRQLAETDMLTGLLNRRTLFDALVAALRPVGPGCGLLYCDLDGFKQVNDALGHAAGDRLLTEVAGRLRASVRTGDLVARLGGDEFLVLCPGADATSLESLAERVREAVTAPYLLPGGTARVGISVGAHLAPAGASADEVVAAADRCMYAEKRRASHRRP